MTCEEFRHHNDQPIAHLLSLTRGLRSALVQHFANCRACRTHVKNMPPEDVSDEIRFEIAAMRARDLQDPEFYDFGQSEYAI